MISAVGTVSYGSVTFDGYISSRVNSRPVYDDSRRTVSYIDYEVTINAKLAASPGGTIDATMDTWRAVLLTPGLEFHYDAHGFGLTSMSVNAGTISDVAWGPAPQSLNFTPLNNTAALVTWVVSVRIPACTSGGATRAPAITAVNFETSWDINDEGLTTRSISGYLEIPLTRAAGGRTVLFTADQFRDKVTPTHLPGFTRQQRFRLSQDKRRLEFNITDTELPWPLPTGVVRGSAEFSISSDLSQGFVKWRCTLNATFTMAANYPKGDAFNRFLLLLQRKLASRRMLQGPKAAQIAAALTSGSNASARTAAAQVSPNELIPQSWDIRENIYTNTSSFTFSFLTINTDIESIIRSTGMWEPIGADKRRWRASLNAVQGNRGTARLAGLPTDDIIIDLCLGSGGTAEMRTTKLPGDARGGAPPLMAGADENGGGGDLGAQMRSTGTPGFLKFDNMLIMHETDKVITHKPLVRAKLRQGPPPNWGLVPLADQKIQLGPGEKFNIGAINQARLKLQQKQNDLKQPVIKNDVKDWKQRISVPTYKFQMKGFAVSIGGRMVRPVLESIGGMPVIQTSAKVGEHSVGAVNGRTVYHTVWDVWYAIDQAPDGVPLMPNPVLHAQ